ncbi:enoyl-CoA hydratase/isomerase family protein, partial [Rhodopseudomonas sp. B29]|uniref:enoyl-CoA hydratase/isomerase family protein n=1 Tax=Rhodopseudomonas sp. B29 TaxID=95607 RepID=UPI001FCBD978
MSSAPTSACEARGHFDVERCAPPLPIDFPSRQILPSPAEVPIMSAEGSLYIERDRDIATITMNRPPANALNAQLIVALLDAIKGLAEDEHPPGIVLTGSGDRFFSAGGDIKEVVGIDVARPRIRLFHELLVAMENYPGPIVCAVRGYAVG